MKKSSTKLLLNAEPFGFGPTAAIATFFPTLRDAFEVVSFVGKGHTLDLQKNLPYDKVHDISASSAEEVASIVKQYDVVLTALDFEFAKISKAQGVKTIIYDPLTWYWATIPDVVRDVGMYIAQDFYGVSERLKSESDSFPKDVKVVPPIVSQKRERSSRDHVLLNLGGLQNPFWSEGVVVTYAKQIITAVLGATSDKKVVISGSQAVSNRLPQFDIKSYRRDEMYKLLESASCAFMTPGLGNIYDAAKFNIPTVWLPPANDSQGQQLQLLKKHDALDHCIDWSDLGNETDYFADQQMVLANIKESVNNLNPSILNEKVLESLQKVNTCSGSAATKLLDRFGTGGAEKVGEVVVEYANNL